MFLVSWLITLGWTALLTYLLLRPGTAGAATESAFVTAFFRSEFSRTDLVEAMAHVGMFGSLTLLWGWTLAFHYPARYAVLLTAAIAASLGVVTEFGQFFVARGALMLDLVANFTGIVLSIIMLHLFSGKIPHRYEMTGGHDNGC